MEITTAEFLTSNTNPKGCPPDNLPEYAFIGRSNVGKSSLINLLVNRKALAKTSGKPGKTQTINHFIINKAWYLVDLPGYGYAKVSKKARTKWLQFILQYLKERSNLMCLFVLIDGRIDPQAIDFEFIDLLGEMRLPFALVFTKTDKVSAREMSGNVEKFKQELLKTWETMPRFYLASTIKKTGRNEILEFISETNKLYRNSTHKR